MSIALPECIQHIKIRSNYGKLVYQAENTEVCFEYSSNIRTFAQALEVITYIYSYHHKHQVLPPFHVQFLELKQEHKINLKQYLLFNAMVNNKGPLTPNEIAKQFEISISSTQFQLKSLRKFPIFKRERVNESYHYSVTDVFLGGDIIEIPFQTLKALWGGRNKEGLTGTTGIYHDISKKSYRAYGGSRDAFFAYGDNRTERQAKKLVEILKAHFNEHKELPIWYHQKCNFRLSPFQYAIMHALVGKALSLPDLRQAVPVRGSLQDEVSKLVRRKLIVHVKRTGVKIKNYRISREAQNKGFVTCPHFDKPVQRLFYGLLYAENASLDETVPLKSLLI